MDLLDAIEKLEAARDHIANPEHWTTLGRRTPDGQNCALGAVETAYGQTAPEKELTPADDKYAPEITMLARATGDPNWEESPQYAIANFNNRHGHQAVIEMFNRAIELAIAELVKESPSSI